MPTGITYNPGDHYWYVADAGNNCIRRITSTGTVSTYAGSNVGGYVDGALSLARFSSPADLAIDGTNMYITDSGNNAIRKIDMSAGKVSTIYK
jgi:DNA-binding beta-propeller fold protein YncE